MAATPDDDERALTAAVTSIEEASSAEVVIAIRPQSGSYLHADILAGAAAALSALAFLVYSPWEFALHWIVLDPLLVGIVAGALGSRIPGLRRLLTSAGARRRRVDEAARSTFVERRVHATARRTGILVYLSLLERDVAVVADLGIDVVSGKPGWKALLDAIEAEMARGAPMTEIAAAIARLRTVLGVTLPRQADDVNELPDGVAGHGEP